MHNLVPLPCYNFKLQIIPPGLDYLVPAVRIRFDSAYVPAKLEPTAMYVFDDSRQEYFLLSYQLVPDDVGARP